jgi:hypothetical protein
LLRQSSEADFSAATGSTAAEWERSQFWFYASMKQLHGGDKMKAEMKPEVKVGTNLPPAKP